MYKGDERLKVCKRPISVRIRLAWKMWTQGYMPLATAIRTFFG